MAADTAQDLDAPRPPGSPMRRDEPTAPVTPGPQAATQEPAPDPDAPDREPAVLPSSTPDGPAVIPSPATPEGEPGPDPEKVSGSEPGPPTQSELANLQLENAGISLDEPSDDSGQE